MNAKKQKMDAHFSANRKQSAQIRQQFMGVHHSFCLRWKIQATARSQNPGANLNLLHHGSNLPLWLPSLYPWCLSRAKSVKLADYDGVDQRITVISRRKLFSSASISENHRINLTPLYGAENLGSKQRSTNRNMVSAAALVRKEHFVVWELHNSTCGKAFIGYTLMNITRNDRADPARAMMG